MARNEHLPIYKAALDLKVHFERLVAAFSRHHKYTLGTELGEGCRALLQQVLRANNAGTREQRAAGLLVLRNRFEAPLPACLAQPSNEPRHRVMIPRGPGPRD